jgi:AraC-like DNA-binding protein
MPIYMDVHIVPGVKALDVAEAHRKDVLLEKEHKCKCITYWIDEERENIFCLIEAPTKEAVNALHGKAHGLIPNKIIEVNSALVGSFLGRIYDPVDAKITDDGLKIFKDPSFRTLLVMKITDPALLKYKFGAERADELLNLHYTIIREKLKLYQGREVEGHGPGFIASFSSSSNAVSCALAILEDLKKADSDVAGLRIGINGGEPVSESDELFGDALQLAEYMCNINKKLQIVISSGVGDAIAKDFASERRKKLLMLTPPEETLLVALFSALEKNWQNPDYNVSDFCESMAMSKSQLYRKTIALCGLSPVLLLKNFRLEKAKELMKKQRYTISEITFESGLTSPSYFTKCFKERYNVLPMKYIDLLH